ncbi:MAG: molybdopterin biosynthesis protein [Rhizobiales bacterium]|nr:molybdopterin biosynthesis protein [Hyphomicrobiales bacterium]
MKTSPQEAGQNQEQFLKVMSRDEAIAAFSAALQPGTLGKEVVGLRDLLRRALAEDVYAEVDTPPFDRSVVDGFAVRAADLATASAGQPVTLRLNAEVIHCGHNPALPVATGTATPISTGGPVPRGADAVIMIEQTEPAGTGAILAMRGVSPGQNISFAGSDIARGQTLLHAGTVITAREIGMLAAVGLSEAQAWRRPRVAVISTGDELIQPGEALPPAKIYDSNGPIIAAALEENGCEPISYGATADDPVRLEAAIREAHRNCDAVILSGGTSKGAGDLTYRVVAGLGKPGIVAHGVALKPGKPLCLAVADGKPVVVLPGFPTSAMFTFHDIVAPALRTMAGLPARQETSLMARVPVRIASELGRTEFVMVALARDAQGYVAHPIGKGSGAVTAFSQADGFVAIDALADAMQADTETDVRLFSAHVKVPDLVIMGSHCAGLDAVSAELLKRGISSRILAIGSLGGLSALKRGECDLAPIHLLDPASGVYNMPFLSDDLTLLSGWRRMQGLVFRKSDPRFVGRGPESAIAAALADPDCIMVNRNQGAGTRMLIDQLLKGQRPAGYWNQPRSHNAVAASIAQGRADWGVAIRPVAEAQGLGFLPLAEEHYDFALRKDFAPGRFAADFASALTDSATRLRALGFEPASL